MPVLAHPLVRLAQAVGVVLDVLQGHGLWADMAAAERVLGVALDRTDQRPPVVFVADFDVQPTDRFAQVTGTVMQGLGHGRLCLAVVERCRTSTMRPAPAPGQPASPRESTDIRRTICDSHLPNCQQAVYNLL
ncbi:hypothetical protein D3C77_622690 [compost metagenome]